MKLGQIAAIVGVLGAVALGAYGIQVMNEPDPNLNTDGDCMTDLEEVAAGTDPTRVDGDGDGVSDCDEIACGANPVDAQEKCYACGWKRNAPDTLVSDGAAVGNIVDNIKLPDQCDEEVALWDFYGQYFIMYMTAAW